VWDNEGCLWNNLCTVSQTYWKKDSVIIAKVNETKLVNVKYPPLYLTPKNGNFHKVSSVGGVAAFIDIHHHTEMKVAIKEAFSESESFNLNGEKCVKLWKTPCPSHYRCNRLNFTKPEFFE